MNKYKKGRDNIKPIFEEERLFLNKKLNIRLPDECWRKSSKIYIDITCDKPLYTFKVENGGIRLVKDNTKLFKDYKQKSISELIEVNKDRLIELENRAVNSITKYIDKRQPQDLYVVSHSSGKDSSVLYYI